MVPKAGQLTELAQQSLERWRQYTRERESSRFQTRRFAGPRSYVEAMSVLRIVHITDQHFGRVTPLRVQEQAVAIANEQVPDLIVATGDFVCHSHEYLDQLEEVMSRFDAPVVAVLGNHDHWSGSREVENALLRAGVEVLDNEHTVVTLDHQALQVVGINDAYTGHADVVQAVKGLRQDLPTVGLSHIAEKADEMWHYGVPMVFSGHTHAGQVTLAGLHEIALGSIGGHRYVHGLYGCRSQEQQPGAVYVSAGIGASVVPLRVGERGQREVAVFELGAQPGSFQEHHEEQQPLKGRAPSPRVQRKRAQRVERKRALKS